MHDCSPWDFFALCWIIYFVNLVLLSGAWAEPKARVLQEDSLGTSVRKEKKMEGKYSLWGREVDKSIIKAYLLSSFERFKPIWPMSHSETIYPGQLKWRGMLEVFMILLVGEFIVLVNFKGSSHFIHLSYFSCLLIATKPFIPKQKRFIIFLYFWDNMQAGHGRK